QQEAALRSFIERHKDFPIEGFAEGKILSLAETLAEGGGRAENVDIDQDGTYDTAIVLAHSRFATKQAMAAGLISSMVPTPNAPLNNIPGTDLDWQIRTIAHEMGHADQPEKSGFSKNLVWEIEAEQDSVILRAFYA
ncbi:MAG: hypothetical protein COB50_04715, partial [Thiotrichales bacterium]